jgi:phosphonate transport system substrate-binding protein
LVTLWGQQWLHRNAVGEVTMRYVSASDSVGQLLVKGEASAGFMSLANFQNLPPPVRDQLRVLAESLPMAGRVYLLNARLRKEQEAISAALWAFAETPEARLYFARYKLGGYRTLEPRELVAMEPYANDVRVALKQVK